MCSFLPESGPCTSNILRWYYNYAVGRCQQFTYGGCHGNQNNFKSLNNCLIQCGKGLLFGKQKAIYSLIVIIFKTLFYFNTSVISGEKCKKDIQNMQCLVNPCDLAQCPKIPDAICVPSSCGQCSAHFFNTSGDNITSSCI